LSLEVYPDRVLQRHLFIRVGAKLRKQGNGFVIP